MVIEFADTTESRNESVRVFLRRFDGIPHPEAYGGMEDESSGGNVVRTGGSGKVLTWSICGTQV